MPAERTLVSERERLWLKVLSTQGFVPTWGLSNLDSCPISVLVLSCASISVLFASYSCPIRVLLVSY